jgi:hypothetical protein
MTDIGRLLLDEFYIHKVLKTGETIGVVFYHDTETKEEVSEFMRE